MSPRAQQWVYESDGKLRPTGPPGPPTFDPITRLADMSRTIRIEEILDNQRVLADASHLKGPNGTAVSWTWSHPRIGGELAAGDSKRVLDTGTGLTTFSVIVADSAGATTTYTRQVIAMSRNYAVNPEEHQHGLADGATKTLLYRPYIPIANLRVRCRWIAQTVGAPTLSQSEWSFGGLTANAEVVMSPTFTAPASVAVDTVHAWRVEFTFPDYPHVPPTMGRLITYRFVATPAPVSTQQITSPMPANHALRGDVTKIPVAAAGDWSVPIWGVTQNAPSQATIMTEFWRQADVNFGAPGNGTGLPTLECFGHGASLYVADYATCPKVDIYYWNQSKWAQGTTLPDNRLFENFPMPVGAVPAQGTDNPIGIWCPDLDGGSYFAGWQVHARPVGGDPTNIRWYAATCGKSTNLPASDSGQDVGYQVSASAINMLTTILTIKECQDALAVYDPSNEAAWDGIVNHAISMGMWQPRGGIYSWPAANTDGAGTNSGAPMIGQFFSIHPHYDLRTVYGDGSNPLAHIIARCIQKHGAILVDTSGAVGYGCQTGRPTYLATGANPWATMLPAAYVPNRSHMTFEEIPRTATIDGVAGTPVYRWHKRLTSKADWDSYQGGG